MKKILSKKETKKINSSLKKQGYKLRTLKRNKKGQFIDEKKDARNMLAFILVSVIALTYPYAWALLEGEPLVFANEIEIIEPTVNIQAVKTTVPHEYLPQMIELSKKYNVPMEEMARIIHAESSWRINAVNKNKNGTVDRHLCQINSKYWLPAVEKAGFEWSDLEACFWIYEQARNKPWYLSEHNWK
jgi:hypothetical protein